MGKTKVKLTGVPETMLIPLRARYLETKKKNGIISDPKSVEIYEQIECDVSGRKEVSTGSQLGVAIRTQIMDEKVTQFMNRNPDGVVVNLGCGLDTRFHRIDNGSVTWYDLDVPEAIELRKHFFDENDRFRFIPKSVTDFSWLESVPAGKPVLFVAEGLLMYFEERQVKELLNNIRAAYPGAEVLLEAMSPFFAKRSEKHPDVKKYNAKFKWGIKTGAQLEQWNQGIRFIGEWYYFDRHTDRHPLIFKAITLIPAVKKMMKIIHINFDNSTPDN